jgi:Kef-type K+ transport system membrane component KefB
MLAARWTGMGWRDAFSVGALMNTRGLVELIVLNLGYDLGILSPKVFAMMVLMALTTTFMTGPLLSLAEWRKSRGAQLAPDARAAAQG